MTTINKINVHTPITQKGAMGYLLWLRQNMPTAYVAAAQRVPAVRDFESALQSGSALGCCADIYSSSPFYTRQSQALGDYSDYVSDASDVSDDVSDVADTFDATALDDSSPITVDYTDQLMNTDTSVVSPDAPDVTAPSDASIVAPPPTLPPIAPAAISAGSAASSVASSPSIASSLPAIASIVAAVAPVVTAAINNNTASINASTVAKTTQAAQLQYAAAVAGASPLASGVVSTANGNYIAAVAPLGQNSLLSSSIGGIPLWILALGGVGAALLLAT